MTGTRPRAPLGAGQFIDLRVLAERAGGSFNGHDALLPGPGHSPHDRSLSVTIGHGGQPIYHSFAGDDPAAIDAYLESLGVNMSTPCVSSKTLHADQTVRQSRTSATGRLALELWRQATPIHGTIAAHYLACRGIAAPYPPSLRFHSRCKDGPFHQPALLAARTMLDTPEAVASIQRTFLRKDGRGKAEIGQAKKNLGPCRGGGVVLGEIGEELLIAEGVESALSAAARFAMSAVATLGVAHTRDLIVPDRVRAVLIAADNDEPGLRAAHALAARLRQQERDVRIETPPMAFKDFNDLANGKERGVDAPRSFRGGGPPHGH